MWWAASSRVWLQAIGEQTATPGAKACKGPDRLVTRVAAGLGRDDADKRQQFAERGDGVGGGD
jgi:hypothetical protein